jgi:hypothetical protein
MNFAPARQAKLPSRLEATNAIDQMALGDVGYTPPWGMWVDNDRNCWLHPKYSLAEQPQGTSEMRVELREDGYHVWAPTGKTWPLVDKPGFASSEDTEYIPVVMLHQDRDY